MERNGIAIPKVNSSSIELIIINKKINNNCIFLLLDIFLNTNNDNLNIFKFLCISDF